MINPDAFWEIDNRWTEEEFWQTYFFLKSWVNAYKSKHVTVTYYVLDPSSDHLWLFCICCVKKNTIYRDGSSVNILSKPCARVYIQDTQMCVYVCVWLKQVCSRRDADSLWQKHKERFDADDGISQSTSLCSTHTFTGSTHTLHLVKESISQKHVFPSRIKRQKQHCTIRFNRLVNAGLMN